MLLGALIRKLESEADAADALAALGDVVLFAQVKDAAQRFEETPGEYVSSAVSHFSVAASDSDWLGLIAEIERARDPGRAALVRILHWALAREDGETWADDPGA